MINVNLIIPKRMERCIPTDLDMIRFFHIFGDETSSLQLPFDALSFQPTCPAWVEDLLGSRPNPVLSPSQKMAPH